jgi:hypothetical protein
MIPKNLIRVQYKIKFDRPPRLKKLPEALLRISLICAFRNFSRFRTAFDGRRSTQAWLQNVAPFQVFINTSVIQDHSRTQSPSYARSTDGDEGLWPNPYQTGI